MDEIKEQVHDMLQEILPDVDIDNTDDLVGSGAIDSMTSIMLVSAIEDEFEVRVSPLEMTPDNFASVGSIAALIERLLDE